MSEETQRKSKIILGPTPTLPSLGGVYPGDLVRTIKAPAIGDVSRVPWESRKQGVQSQRTVAAPTDDAFLFQALFPAGTAGPAANTAVYSADPGTHIIRHDLDLSASQISMSHVDESGQHTRRTFQYGKDDARNTACLTVADQESAHVFALPQGRHECHLTLDPTETGEKRIVGTMKLRQTEKEWTKYPESHRYGLKNGKITGDASSQRQSTIR
jgi:hypothetical protein